MQALGFASGLITALIWKILAGFYPNSLHELQIITMLDEFAAKEKLEIGSDILKYTPPVLREAEGPVKGPSMWFCYIVKCSDSSYYVGITKDLESRVSEHNAGQGSAYTAARRPVRLVWSEEHDTRSSATRREREIKRWRRARKEGLIAERSHSPV